MKIYNDERVKEISEEYGVNNKFVNNCVIRAKEKGKIDIGVTVKTNSDYKRKLKKRWLMIPNISH